MPNRLHLVPDWTVEDDTLATAHRARCAEGPAAGVHRHLELHWHLAEVPETTGPAAQAPGGEAPQRPA